MYSLESISMYTSSGWSSSSSSSVGGRVLVAGCISTYDSSHWSVGVHDRYRKEEEEGGKKGWEEKGKRERRTKEREGVGERRTKEREGMGIKGREVGGIMYIWQTEE